MQELDVTCFLFEKNEICIQNFAQKRCVAKILHICQFKLRFGKLQDLKIGNYLTFKTDNSIPILYQSAKIYSNAALQVWQESALNQIIEVQSLKGQITPRAGG